MSCKPGTCNAACNAICNVNAPSKYVGNSQALKIRDTGNKYVTANPSKEVVLLGKGDVVEVTVKREDKLKGQKRTSPSINPGHGQKAEEKRPMINIDKVLPRDWGRIFMEQNLLYMRQAQSSMFARYGENKETRKQIGAKRQQANIRNFVKYPDAALSKRTPCKKKSDDNLKIPCCAPVLVQDRAIQHPDIIDNANRFAEFNPVRTLSFLIKELKDLVKSDKKTSEIFTGMEQTLSKIPVDSGKPLELGDLEIKLQTSTMQLKDSSKKMKAMCESWTSEREKLHSQIQKRDIDLKEANQRQADLEIEIKMLTRQLEDTNQTAKDEVTALRRQVKKDELSEKLISDLRIELAKQTELARKNYINNQYLTIERDKLLQLSSYQEKLIAKYQHTIKELQTQVAEQLKALSEARANEENASTQISISQTGFVCSSPTSTFSNRSNNKSWHDLSEVSSVSSRHTPSKENANPVKNSVHLELVSLELDGESSHGITFESYRDQATDDNKVARNNRNDTIMRNANAKDAIAKKSLQCSSRKSRRNDKENESYEARKESSSNNTISKYYSLHRDVPSEILRGVAANKLIIGTRKPGDQQSRIPVNVPSPLREYPCPDWSDSSLSSVSMASNLDMVPSNDV